MSDIEENSVEETEEVGASTTEEQGGNEQESATEQKPEKKYTDADVDRIVSKRLNREREKLSKALGEGQKESELEIRERKVLERELNIEVKERLEKDGLPQSLSKLMNYSSAEGFTKSYDEITETFKEALRTAIKPYIAGRTPRVSSPNFSKNADQQIADIFKSR